MGKILIYENGGSYYVDSAVDVGSETTYTGCTSCGRMIKASEEYCSGCWAGLSQKQKSALVVDEGEA